MDRLTLTHYRLGSALGRGGMGVVYEAEDVRLGRRVAIKVLPTHLAADPERRERLAQEARAASALNHPNIVTIHEIDRHEGEAGPVDFVVMEYVAGESLDRVIPESGLSVSDVLDLATAAASALAAAHRAGIVHRDIKPANMMVTAEGRLKVLDFGLAKLVHVDDPLISSAPTMASPVHTRQGAVVGTPVYMSPEQAQGLAVDARSDVYSLGLVLFEMIAGRRPFPDEEWPGSSSRASAVSVRAIRPGVPEDLARIVDRCLDPDPERRYATAAELELALQTVRDRLAAREVGAADLLRRPAFLGTVALFVLAVLGVAGWVWFRGADARWARETAFPEIERLIEADEPMAAYRLAREAERRVPGDPQLEPLKERFTFAFTIRTDPPGAQVAFKPYLANDEAWEPLSVTPIEDAALPGLSQRFEVRKEGYEPLETAPNPGLDEHGVLIQIDLWRDGSGPDGMIRVPRGRVDRLDVELGPYWLDRYEVTNRRFQAFVDDGGYRRPELWEHPFERDGETLGWKEAMELFLDSTGRSGPATWGLGAYPEGAGDLPVGGVSWFEAAAYARWADKSLPTLHHWKRAASGSLLSDILLASNFESDGPAPVGTFAGLGPFGTWDMAGNVKEWSSTATGDRRYLLGGAWTDPSYVFSAAESMSPFERDPTHGFRCAVYPEPPPAEALAPIDMIAPAPILHDPVGDDVYAALTSIYDYDETSPLDARVEAIDDSSPHWRRETVSYRAGYGDERVPAYLFVPKNSSPPFQTVVYFPTSLAEMSASSRRLELRWFDFVIRSGRAVLHPVYKGTFERRLESGVRSSTARRDLIVQWSKELGRSIDYLDSRSDVEPDRIAFFGHSLGAIYAPMLIAMEPRFRTAVILGGGALSWPMPPEVDTLNFAPRVRVPVLMLAGRNDFIRPVEAFQRPLLERFGTPSDSKRLAVLEGGHVPVDRNALIRELLDWLDRHLGPVRHD